MEMAICQITQLVEPDPGNTSFPPPLDIGGLQTTSGFVHTTPKSCTSVPLCKYSKYGSFGFDIIHVKQDGLSSLKFQEFPFDSDKLRYH